MTTSATTYVPLWLTAHALDPEVRVGMIGLLNQQLADAIALALHAKQAHWNVKGPNFTGLHALFDEVADDLAELIDTMAERAVELGGTALGTAEVVATATRLDPYPRHLSNGEAHVRALGGSLATFAHSSTAAIDAAATKGDAVTADVFTEVSRRIDKLRWKVAAHLPLQE